MILNSIYAFFATLGLSVLFNISKKHLFFTSFGGALAWFSYLLTLKYSNSNFFAYFAASVIAAVYSEIMARVIKAPVTIFIICSIIPLVPGGGMYNTMLEAIRGNISRFLTIGVQTLSIAGAIAAGIIFVSSLTKIFIIKNKKAYQ
ncbi:MAG: threonine/serine exporter family protein [Bacillota bacterium]|nr:threonine/serine exporter family protein [Bacillota bacterium]